MPPKGTRTGPTPKTPEARSPQPGNALTDTRVGILLLLLGVSLAWVPFLPASASGIFAYVVGLWLVFRSRRSFGLVHARNAVLALGLYAAGTLGPIPLALIAAFAYLGGVRGTALGLLIGLLFIVAILRALGELLITYALQNGPGRSLLRGAFASNVFLLGLLFLLPALTSPRPLELIAQFATSEPLAFLFVIPASLNAIAYGSALIVVRSVSPPAHAAPPPGHAM